MPNKPVIALKVKQKLASKEKTQIAKKNRCGPMGGICDKDAANFCQAEHRAELVGEQPDLPLPLSAKARSNHPSSQRSKVSYSGGTMSK
jgi:hypothetical protein